MVCIGGGITGDIQVNDTHVHHKLKIAYRELESKMMLEKLRQEPHKIPTPNRDDMMTMMDDSWTSLTTDPNLALKQNFISNNIDGSEDHLVSDKLFELIGTAMTAFRKKLVARPAPKTLKELVSTLTPPKGVRMKKTSC